MKYIIALFFYVSLGFAQITGSGSGSGGPFDFDTASSRDSIEILTSKSMFKFTLKYREGLYEKVSGDDRICEGNLIDLYSEEDMLASVYAKLYPEKALNEVLIIEEQKARTEVTESLVVDLNSQNQCNLIDNKNLNASEAEMISIKIHEHLIGVRDKLAQVTNQCQEKIIISRRDRSLFESIKFLVDFYENRKIP